MAETPTSPPAALPIEPGPYGSPERSEWLDIDWSRHLRWVDTPTGRVHVCDYGEGDGVPAVLIHGHSGCWQNWLENIPHLGRSRRVIAVDLSGFGASPLGGEPISITGYARLVDDVCEELGIERAAMIGNSMGGFVAADVAIHHDTRVDRLVLVSAAGVSDRYVGVFSTKLMAGRLLERGAGVLNALTPRDPLRDPLFRRPRSRTLFWKLVFHDPARIRKELMAEFARGTGKPGAGSAILAIGSYDFRELIADVRCPTLIVHGENDLIIPPSAADEFERLIPGSRKVVWPATGHCPMAERPVAFNRLLDAFLIGG